MQTLQQAYSLHRAGQFQQAELLYRDFLKRQPQHADALHLLGILLHQSEHYAEAIEQIESALKVTPHNPTYLNNLGLAYRANQNFDLAIQCYQKALQITPNDIDLYNNIGNLYRDQALLTEAASYYQRAICIQPKHAVTHYNLGNVFQDEGNLSAAVECYRRALSLDANDVDIYLQLGNVLAAQGKHHESATALKRAAGLAPMRAEIHYNLGNAYRELGRASDAASCYRTTLSITPHDADAHNNLGNVLRELGQLDQAILCYENALKINPDLHHARIHLLHQRQHICDWNGLETEIQAIRHLVNTEAKAQISPFAFLALPSTTRAEQKRCAENWVRNRYAALMAQSGKFTHTPTTKSKLRIGYLSGDFRLHPLASLITELIELHNRQQFEIHAYSYSLDDGTPARKRLEQAFDHFHDIRSESLHGSAARIYHDQIDILIDLTGFTQTSRTGILALRPAPIQINWLGFPGTMGSLFCDYIIGDEIVTPEMHAEDYSETILRMPYCYQPNDSKRPVALTPTKSSVGLPEESFVFCAFNQTFKITPNIFQIWMRLLKNKPKSVLWLLECNAWAKQNLMFQAQAHDIPSERLIFAPRIPMAEHLARQKLADLFLDTLPYNAHTTASDALWVGLPIVTCLGETFSARVAASILKAANLENLVSKNLAEYEIKAHYFAQHPDELMRIRSQLNHTISQSALFNAAGFAQSLESLFISAWNKQI